MRKAAPFVVLTFYILTREMFFQKVGGTVGGLILTGSPLLSSRRFSSFAVSFLARFFRSSALTENLAQARLQPPPQALRFLHGRGELETRVTVDEPQGTMGRVSFPPSFAQISKERRLGTEAGPGYVLVIGISDTPVYMFMP